MEPGLPIRPQFSKDFVNPCVEMAGKTVCLPYVHVISGWHMFSSESLGWLKNVKQLEMRGGGGCFDDWDGDQGGNKWAQSWGGPPASGAVITAHCDKLLSWYPAFAGRYTSAWGKSYGPCKEAEIAKNPKADYYATAMWQVCRPRALSAHDAAMGTGGAGLEATPPFVMKALYGPRVKVISALRNPTDRLETSFWSHRHYPLKYGSSPAGLHKYFTEQSAAFLKCEKAHDARRCAHLFELMSSEYADVFFHCDQLIRGLYEPFVRDWHAAFGRESLLVLKAEDLLDRPAQARATLLTFLNLPGADDASKYGALPDKSYAQLHAQDLAASKAQPMLPATRAAIDGFYRPHNTRLEALLGWQPGTAWGAAVAPH